ncbi:MAG: hypothetical protein ABW217_13135 [Polyangiaceae bacterium]
MRRQSARPTQGAPPVFLASACAALLIAQHVAGRTCRDALFLSSFPLSELPKVMLGAAALGLIAVLAASWVMPRHGPGRVISLLLFGSALLHVIEWRLLDIQRPLAVVLIYLHTSIAGGIAVSGFWSIVSELFDPHALRRSAGLVGAGSAVGGLLGGLIAQGVSGFGVESILLPLSGAALLAGFVIRRLAQGVGAPSSSKPESRGLRSVTGSSYLRTMATFVALTGLSGAVVDFAFKANVSAAWTSGPDLVKFFAAFYTSISVASVVLQLTVARWVPARFGLGTSLAVMPFAMFVLGALSLFVASPWLLVLLRGTTVALETSLFRAAYEPLYAPLPVWQKRSAKTIIDVAFARVGEVSGSGWVLLVASFIPVLASGAGLATGVVAAGICIFLALRLERGYVAELALSLRTGKVSLEPYELIDATTRLTLSRTGLGIDRDMLLRQIEELRQKNDAPGAATSVPPGSNVAATALPGSTLQHSNEALSLPAPSSDLSSPSLLPRVPAPSSSPSVAPGDSLVPSYAPGPDPAGRLGARIAALQSGDPARIRSALANGPLELELVSLVVPLLEREGCVDTAVIALRGVALRIVGQLVDVLLDPEQPFRVRRRVPRVLRACAHPRAVRGLLDALSDPEFELRYRCALALRDLVRQDKSLRPASRVVLDAAAREIEQGPRAQTVPDPMWLEDEASEVGMAREVVSQDRAVDHVFTLLGLTVEDEALELARISLSSRDEKLRGTALEYLEHVLPEPIRSRLWPYLQAGYAPRPATPRATAEIADELKRSFG